MQISKSRARLTALFYAYFTLAFNSPCLLTRSYQSFESFRISRLIWPIAPPLETSLQRGLSTKLPENRPNSFKFKVTRVSRGEKLGSTQTRRRRARVERLHLLLTTPYHRQSEERDTAPGAGFLYYIYQAKRMDFTLFVPAFPIPRNSISEDSTRNRVTRARPNFKSIPLCPIRYRSDRRNSVLKNAETCFEAVPRPSRGKLSICAS